MKERHSLQPYNTLKLAATARYFIELTSLEQLQQVLTDWQETHLPKLILGSGSNILFTQDYPGLVIKNNLRGIHCLQEQETQVWLQVAAGENWHNFVLYCLNHGYYGVENLSLIPGTVGAAPIQNIGAYGVEFESVFDSLEAIDLLTQEQVRLTHEDCAFGYRDSVFKHRFKEKYIITSVTLKLSKYPKLNLNYGEIKQQLAKQNIADPTPRDLSNAIIHIRQQKLPDPTQVPNAGSFFKNPVITQEHFSWLHTQFPSMPYYAQPNDQVKISAAWLIESCQLKGFTHEGAGISKNHALVIVNYDTTSGKTILDLVHHIQKTVDKKFGIVLQPEVNIY